MNLRFDSAFDKDGYAFLIFRKNEKVSFRFSDMRVTGLLSVFNSINEAVSNFGRQDPPAEVGMDAFEFWCPQRRPAGKNIAMKFDPPLADFAVENLRNGVQRPVDRPNAWVADFADKNPQVEISWDAPKTIARLELSFDTDFDHPMESVLMTHPESAMPFCVQNFRVLDGDGKTLHTTTGNYQTRKTILFPEPVNTAKLIIQLDHPAANVPAALFEARVYEE
ncbi:MAG: hypothetical protein INR69_20830 [Mucilaginibacter polytrichastri]|nr:hypothetical protein [Mucilaginibacter polytrichastri]